MRVDDPPRLARGLLAVRARDPRRAPGLWLRTRPETTSDAGWPAAARTVRRRARGRRRAARRSSRRWSAGSAPPASACGWTSSAPRRRAPGSAAGPTASPLAEDWIGPRRSSSVAVAGEHLVRRYLAAFGPASRKDVASFTGLAPRPLDAVARRAWSSPPAQRGRRGAARRAGRAPCPTRTRRRPALPADVGRDAARPRAAHRHAARGVPAADLQHEDPARRSRRSSSTARWRARGATRTARCGWSRSRRWRRRTRRRSARRRRGSPRFTPERPRRGARPPRARRARPRCRAARSSA